MGSHKVTILTTAASIIERALTISSIERDLNIGQAAAWLASPSPTHMSQTVNLIG